MSMNDQARQVLLTLRGRELTRSLLKGTLADLCPQCPGERAALLAAFDNGVVQELGGVGASGDSSLMLARLTRQLEVDACLTPDAAHWAVESFALFYRITSASPKSVIAASATSAHPNEQNRRVTSPQANKPNDRLETVHVVPPPFPKNATSSNSRLPPDRLPPAKVVASKTTPSIWYRGMPWLGVILMVLVSRFIVSLVGSGSSPAKQERSDETVRVHKPALEYQNLSLSVKIVDLGMDLMPIRPGSFIMGSPAQEEGRCDDEKSRRVWLTKPFWMGRTEVTQGQWQSIMKTTVREQRDKDNSKDPLYGEGSDYPMYYVNWDESSEFCQKLTAREREAGRLPVGYEYRLPTEAQWEYACRAGSTTRFSSGDSREKLQEVGWYAENSGNQSYPDEEWLADVGKADKTDLSAKVTGRKLMNHPVGEKQANAWGLYDMHGNVFEWCRDWYGAYPADPADPVGLEAGAERIARGGCWVLPSGGCRSATRSKGVPGNRDGGLGFRVALVPAVR